MESVHHRLIRILESDSLETSQEDADALAQHLIHTFCEYTWFPQSDMDRICRIAREAAELVLSKLLELKSRNISPAIIQKIVTDFSSSPLTAAFLTPESIRLIYCDPPTGWSEFARQGAEYHCRLIRHASSLAVRKYVSGMKRISLDVRELEDELFGVVMEEVLRCLSDQSARFWMRNGAEPSIFPSEGARGLRRGMIVRVALSKDGNRLATFRSDRHLFVWAPKQNELIRSWDLNLLMESAPEEKKAAPEALFFSESGSRIALETQDQKIYVFSLNQDESSIRDSSIRVYAESEKQEFLNEFGVPFISDRNLIEGNGFTLRTRTGDASTLVQYSSLVFDWCNDRENQVLATASEIERAMPEWMNRAGFDRAVFHIAKKRLIDLIRKRTHTNYACWRCGSMISGLSDTQCRRCGADFTRCPMGCATREILDAANRWQCPRCGTASRISESAISVEVEDWYADSQSHGADWRDSHDMQRILDVLKNRSIAYKKKDIPCDRVIVLKAEGKTNEEIGAELGIPRGSVDYVWNQCRQQIILAFGK